MAASTGGRVVAVCTSSTHSFSKPRQSIIKLQAGLGVEGDAHSGATVIDQDAKDPYAPNLRQIHLLASERLAELGEAGFEVKPGQIGENITTAGVDLQSLPLNTELQLGSSAVVRLKGLRNPCTQLSSFQKGLTQAMLGRSEQGKVVRKAGVLGTVEEGGAVAEGDAIIVHLPTGQHIALPVLY